MRSTHAWSSSTLTLLAVPLGPISTPSGIGAKLPGIVAPAAVGRLAGPASSDGLRCLLFVLLLFLTYISPINLIRDGLDPVSSVACAWEPYVSRGAVHRSAPPAHRRWLCSGLPGTQSPPTSLTGNCVCLLWS